MRVINSPLEAATGGSGALENTFRKRARIRVTPARSYDRRGKTFPLELLMVITRRTRVNTWDFRALVKVIKLEKGEENAGAAG